MDLPAQGDCCTRLVDFSHHCIGTIQCFSQIPVQRHHHLTVCIGIPSLEFATGGSRVIDHSPGHPPAPNRVAMGARVVVGVVLIAGGCHRRRYATDPHMEVEDMIDDWHSMISGRSHR